MNINRSDEKNGLIQKKGRSMETIADTDYADDLVLLTNTSAQA